MNRSGDRPDRDRVGLSRAKDTQRAIHERVFHQIHHINQIHRHRGCGCLVRGVCHPDRQRERRRRLKVQLRLIRHRDHARVADRERSRRIPRRERIRDHITHLDITQPHRGHDRTVCGVIIQTHRLRRKRDNRGLIHIQQVDREDLFKTQPPAIRYPYRHVVRRARLIIQQRPIRHIQIPLPPKPKPAARIVDQAEGAAREAFRISHFQRPNDRL